MNAQHITRVTKNLERCHSQAAENAGDGDHLLVAQAKSGSACAFGALYERHRSKIYRVALRILRNQQDAEDAVQQSFQRAFTSLVRFREDSSFSTWMGSIAINEALMMLRQRRSTRTLTGMENDCTDTHPPLDFPDDQPTPEQALARTELRNAVIQAISRLRHNLRVVAVLRVLHGLPSAEIARRLGLSVSAVKGRIFHASRDLRRHLEQLLCRREP